MFWTLRFLQLPKMNSCHGMAMINNIPNLYRYSEREDKYFSKKCSSHIIIIHKHNYKTVRLANYWLQNMIEYGEKCFLDKVI